MVHENDETGPERDGPDRMWAPLCRELGLALITARTEGFSDRDAEHVVILPVPERRATER
jgi:hypothetical protein